MSERTIERVAKEMTHVHGSSVFAPKRRGRIGVPNVAIHFAELLRLSEERVKSLELLLREQMDTVICLHIRNDWRGRVRAALSAPPESGEEN